MDSVTQCGSHGETAFHFLRDEPWLYDVRALRQRFDNFIAEMDTVADVLVEYLADNCPEFLPLDCGTASLDRLERAYMAVLDGQLDFDSPDLFATRVARYLGTVVQKQLGARWELCEDSKDPNFGLPCLTHLKGQDELLMWSPLEVVNDFAHTREIGTLRRAAMGIGIR
jgi:hypothetical protein